MDYAKLEYVQGAEDVITLPFSRVKIVLLSKKGTPLPAGVRHVVGSHFEVEAQGVDKLLVKRVHIGSLAVTLNYEGPFEFDLPDTLAVGAGGVLQATTPGDVPVQIVSRVVKPAEATGCSHAGGMP